MTQKYEDLAGTSHSAVGMPVMVAPRRPLRLLALGPQEVCPPTDGGKEGIHGALAALARLADVTYACPASVGSDSLTPAYAAIGVQHVPVPFEPRESVSLILGATAQLKPFKFAKYCTAEASERYSAAIGTKQFDAIICFHAHTEELGQRLRRLNGWTCPILVREHNIEYELITSYRASLNPFARALAWPFELLTRRAEHRMWRRADAVAFLTDRDLATARSAGGGENLILAPEGVPIPARRVISHPTTTLQLLIPLNQRATQSVANLKQFLESHWRATSRAPALSQVSLAITGVSLDRLAALTAISEQELTLLRVRALGFLPSLAEAFSTSLALVSPTFVGGGIRKKVLEAMANQLPVIATDLDIDTCSYFDPPHNLLRLGSPAEFVTCVERLIEDAALWTHLSDAGRRTVEQHATWSAFADVVIAEANRLVIRRQSGIITR